MPLEGSSKDLLSSFEVVTKGASLAPPVLSAPGPKCNCLLQYVLLPFLSAHGKEVIQLKGRPVTQSLCHMDFQLPKLWAQ